MKRTSGWKMDGPVKDSRVWRSCDPETEEVNETHYYEMVREMETPELLAGNRRIVTVCDE